MSRSVRPYLIASPGDVTFDGWSIATGEEWSALPEFLPDWDYNTDLRLRAEVRVDGDGVRASAALDKDAPLNISVSWRTVDGRVGGTALLRPVVTDGADLLDVLLPGDQLGPEIDVWVRVVLGEDRTGGAGRARLAGSVLWERSTRLALVGRAARFPAVVLDFAACRLDIDASWVLELPDDLNTPVLGGLLLLLNSRDTELVSAVSGRLRDSDRTVRSLHEQVAVQLLDHAVVNADVLERGRWDDGSLAESLILLGRRVPGGLAVLAGLRESNPTAYRAALVGEVRRSTGGGLGR